MTDPKRPDQNSAGMSRRNFLKNTGLVAGGLVGGSLFGGLITNQMNKNDKKSSSGTGEKNAPRESYEARIFFSRNEDFDTLSAATERLFPETDVGPGAIALGVPYFIDRQLAGDWGTNSHDYTAGPFPQITEVDQYEEMDTDQNEKGPLAGVQIPVPTPRYQTRMNRGALFLEGIHALQRAAHEQHEDEFKKLDGKLQDELLTLCENGELEMNGSNSGTFFDLLLSTTIEGAYADPAYGGNRDMEAWRMKEYPGPRMSYLQDIETEEFIVMEPESLRNYQGH